MNRTGWIITPLVILVATACADAQEGRPQRVRDDVNTTTSTNDYLGDFLGSLNFTTDADGTSLGGTVVLYTVLAPFCVPAAVLGDDYKHTLYFAPYPYVNQYPGYQLLKPEVADQLYSASTSDVRRRSWVGRVSIENGNDYAGLNRFNGQLRLDHASRFGIITNWNYFREDLCCGRTAEATIGDTNLIFRFAQNEVASVYGGVGFRILADHWHTNTGVNVTYGGDWFPVRPLVISAVLDTGTLGNTSVFHARASAGAIVHGYEFFAGYDFLRIGVTNLQGPMAGVRLWF